MTRTKLAFLVAAASTLALTEQGAHAAFLNPVTGALAARSSLVLQTHACHERCSYGPMQTGPRHRHMRDCTLTTRWCRDRPWLFWQRWWHRY